MDILKAQAEPSHDDDDFGDPEARPLLGWLLMAVALVTMAFLIGGNAPESSASASDGVKSPMAAAATEVAGALAARHSAFGG